MDNSLGPEDTKYHVIPTTLTQTPLEVWALGSILSGHDLRGFTVVDFLLKEINFLELCL